MKVHRIEIVQVVTFKPSRLINPPKTVQWFWHALARNGRKLGWTGEAHHNIGHCVDALNAVVNPWERGIPVYEVSADGKTKRQIGPNRESIY